MTNVAKLGPLMFTVGRLLAIILLVIFTYAAGKIDDWTGRETTKAATWALTVGIVAARVAYVVTHWTAYSHDWLSTLAF